MQDKVTIDADTDAVEQALKNLERLSQSFGAQLTGALKGAAVSGKSLEDVLRRHLLEISAPSPEERIRRRADKYREMGAWTDGDLVHAAARAREAPSPP